MARRHLQRFVLLLRSKGVLTRDTVAQAVNIHINVVYHRHRLYQNVSENVLCLLKADGHLSSLRRLTERSKHLA